MGLIHRIGKKVFFGRFQRTWRWPEEISQGNWERVTSPSSHLGSAARLCALILFSLALLASGVLNNAANAQKKDTLLVASHIVTTLHHSSNSEAIGISGNSQSTRCSGCITNITTPSTQSPSTSFWAQELPPITNTLPLTNTIYSVSMVSSDFGHAVGANGTILQRRNGQPWEIETSPITQTLYGVSMVSSDFGHAVGANGTILQRRNGQPWEIETSPITQTLYGVSMVSSDFGHAVGANGTILQRRNGQPWEIETSPVTYTLYGVFMQSSDFGYVVGEGGTILSRSQGNPWQIESSPTNKTLYSLAMITLGYGKAVGEDGTILTIADGKPWLMETSPTTQTLHAVMLMPGQGYWAVGESGTILFYPFDGDERNTWQIISSPTTATLFSISGNRNYMQALGANGVVLEYSGGRWHIPVGVQQNKIYIPVIIN